MIIGLSWDCQLKQDASRFYLDSDCQCVFSKPNQTMQYLTLTYLPSETSLSPTDLRLEKHLSQTHLFQKRPYPIFIFRLSSNMIHHQKQLLNLFQVFPKLSLILLNSNHLQCHSAQNQTTSWFLRNHHRMCHLMMADPRSAWLDEPQAYLMKAITNLMSSMHCHWATGPGFRCSQCDHDLPNPYRVQMVHQIDGSEKCRLRNLVLIQKLVQNLQILNPRRVVVPETLNPSSAALLS